MSDNIVIEFLKLNGPSTPAKLAKHLNTTQLLASAILGELASKSVIAMTSMKIGGGSPLYYIKEQEEQLQNFAEALNPKDRQALEILKDNGVLRDSEQSPLVRISLRAIKDFAVPLKITMDNKTELFWKWYLMDNKEAEIRIKQLLGIEKNIEEEEPVEKKKEERSPEVERRAEEKRIVERGVREEKEIEQEREKQKEPIKQERLLEENIKKPIPKRKEAQENIIDSQLKSGVYLNADFAVKATNPFGKNIKKYFNEKEIKIKSYDIIKKNKEFTFMLSVPSAVGSSGFYCKAIDKKKLNEGDLALALIEAQHKNLPLIFISTGEISKKLAEKMNNIFKDVNLIKI